MDARLKETDSWISGVPFSNQPPRAGMQGGVVGPVVFGGTRYLPVTKPAALSRHPRMAASPCQTRQPEQHVLHFICKPQRSDGA